MVGILIGGCRSVMPWHDIGMTLDLHFVRMLSTSTFETIFSLNKKRAGTDNSIYIF